jgi:hypothetical protein
VSKVRTFSGVFRHFFEHNPPSLFHASSAPAGDQTQVHMRLKTLKPVRLLAGMVVVGKHTCIHVAAAPFFPTSILNRAICVNHKATIQFCRYNVEMLCVSGRHVQSARQRRRDPIIRMNTGDWMFA